MKRHFASAAALLLLPVPSASFAQEAETAADAEQVSNLELAREVIELGFPEETRIGSMLGVADQLIAQMRAGNPQWQSDPRLERVFDRFAARVLETTSDVLSRHIDDMMEGMALAYADSFSREELLAIREFVSSPAGRGFLTRVTNLNTHPAYAEANQAYIDEYMTYMPGLQQELLRDLTETLSQSEGAKGGD